MKRIDDINSEKRFNYISKEYSKKYITKDASGHSFNARLNLILKMLSNKSLGHLLDIGGGPGIYFPRLKDRLQTYTLIDISLEMVKISKALSYGDVPSSLRVGSVYDLPFDDKKFDNVLAIGLFEYLDHPIEALRCIKSVTKSSGKIFISFPNAHSPMRKLSDSIYKLFGKPTPFRSNTFLLKDVQNMANKLELDIVAVKSYNAQLIPFPLTWKIPNLSYWSSKILEPILNRSSFLWGTGFIIKLKLY